MKIKRFNLISLLSAKKIGLFILLFKLSSLEATIKSNEAPTNLMGGSAGTGMMTTRCEGLLDTRGKKVELKQKAYSLKKRISHLDKITPAKLITKKKKIELANKKIDLKIQILNQEISNIEEDIVRKGCPGIKL